MKELVASIGVILVIFFGIVGLAALSAMLNGWVLSILWGWFVVPTFHLPPLSIPVAIGIALVVDFLTKQETPDDPKNENRSSSEKLGRATARLVARPFIALLFGWIVYLFT